ncbi:MAG: hypothetical protein RIS85_722 [Pseudomonadota bacterium]|jgi:hypothetical protein
MEPTLFKKLRNRRLFWVFIGVALSAATQVTIEMLIQRQPVLMPDKPRNASDRDFSKLTPHREMQPSVIGKQSEWLVIASSDMSKEKQTAVIGSVGACMGKFEVKNYSHGYEIRIPTKKLRQSDYECILRETTKIFELVKKQDLGPRESEFTAIHPTITIHDDL